MLNLARFRLQPDERLVFLRGFLRSPQQVGSVVPSSRFLERRLVRLAGTDSARLVVELGPGTGGTTRALLRALPAHARLLAIEIDPTFAAFLESLGDERLLVHRGSAEHLGEALRQHGLPAPDAVVSGIPFSTIPPPIGRRIIRSVWDVLAPGGCFVAYQLRGHVHELARPVCGPARVGVELRNIPPMRIYRWQKPLKVAAERAA